MTGYAAVVRRDDADVAESELRALLPAMRHRGPHGESVVMDGVFGAASALLDVGDLRLAPAWSTEGRYVVAGQIRLDARAELTEALHRANVPVNDTDPDVRLFACAWCAWGDEAPARLLGDFSAVIHDVEARTTALVRDPFGVRMLFYHLDETRLVASNTLGAVLDAGVSRELDEDAIADFVAEGFNENPATSTYRAVRRVPAAHVVRVGRDGGVASRCYWTLPTPPVDRSRRPEQIVGGFRARLEASVRDRLRVSSVSVFMSGGIDSTTLAAIAARELGDRSQVVARTAYLPTLLPSEDTGRAQLAARFIGIPQVLTDVDEYGFREGTRYRVPATPEPHGDLDLLALQDELRRACEHSPVAFWGEDPDAYLAPPHLLDLLRGSSAPRVATDVLAYAWREGARPHLRLRELLFRRRRRGVIDPGPAWLRADLRARRAERLRTRAEPSHPTRSEVARRLEQYHWQPFLESLDAGFHGIPIDVRLPYLDLRLIDYALATPPIPWMQHKRLLREAARGLIPDAVRTAPKRGLAGLHEARLTQWWARGPIEFRPSDALARYVDVGALKKISVRSSTDDALAHLRLRLLDRWLRTNG
jgi:asparagine synthase (glutamine-hydrolysing)